MSLTCEVAAVSFADVTVKSTLWWQSASFHEYNVVLFYLLLTVKTLHSLKRSVSSCNIFFGWRSKACELQKRQKSVEILLHSQQHHNLTKKAIILF
jgi:hypothetical protein